MTLQCPTLQLNQLINNAIKSSQRSKLYIKKVIPQIIQCILFQRINYERDDFRTQTFNDLEYHVFKRKLNSGELKWIRLAIKETMSALEKNCLREIYVLFVSSTDPNVVREYFRFGFQPMDPNVLPMMQTNAADRGAQLHRATYELFQTIANLESSFEPHEVDVKFMMSFYEENSPKNLRFKTFGSGNKEYNQNLLASLSNKRNLLGTMKTGFDKVKCHASIADIDNMVEDLSYDCIDID